MAPSPETVSRELERIVWYSLDNGLVENATFFAQRYLALRRDSFDAKYLLARANFEARRYLAAVSLLQDARDAHAIFLYARSCFALSKFADAERALQALITKNILDETVNMNKHTNQRRCLIPDRASILCMLGCVYRKMELSIKAIEYYTASLKLNPFLWEAYEALCQLGQFLSVEEIYGTLPAESSHDLILKAKPVRPRDRIYGPPSERTGLFTPDGNCKDNCDAPMFNVGTLFNHPNSLSVFSAQSPSTPTLQFGKISNAPVASKLETKSSTLQNAQNQPTSQLAPPPPIFSHSMSSTLTAPTAASRTRAASRQEINTRKEIGRERSTSRTSNKSGTDGGIIRRQVPSRTLKGTKEDEPTRRSTRLHTSTSAAGSTITRPLVKVTKTALEKRKVLKQPMKTRSTDIKTDDLKPPPSKKESVKEDGVNENEIAAESQKQILQLLSICADGYQLLSQYQCHKAIEIFSKLPPDQYNTGWVLALIGKAYFEIVNYPAAERVFEQLRKIEPWRIRDMEVYSTLLWHMQKKVQLSFLAHELLSIERNSPQAWITVGNCFSSQREHETALKCFQRAISLDETFTYAYTLSGHESVSTENYDKALSFFQTAMRINPRHYNSWYGIGMVYLKIGKIELAESNFQRAISINPTNAVLMCCLGLVYEKLNRFPEALRTYENACVIAPTSALARFRKAKILILMKHYRQALDELVILEELAPDEANIHFLLGKLYKQVGDRTRAMRHLTWALDLDPKASHLIREAIEKIDVIEENLLSAAAIEATD